MDTQYTVNWQKILAQGFRTSTDLLNYLQLPPETPSLQVEKQFATRIPLGFANRMQKGDRYDPLLLQVLADDKELLEPQGYVSDPLQEKTFNPHQGLIHKYYGRVLLTLTGTCAIHCRYCFRRHFPYEENNPGRSGWKKTLEYIQNNPSIHEVILSGGDPLLSSDTVLKELLEEIENIPHIKILRFHTRVPVVLPERITDSFLEIYRSTKLKKVMVMHVNHPQELDHTVFEACEKLRSSNFHLLNQSVLLKGINDEVSILVDLSMRLLDTGILPYYLHVLDKVQGVAHFDIPLEKTLDLYQQLQAQLPGYLLPKLVKEEPGKGFKTLLGQLSVLNET